MPEPTKQKYYICTTLSKDNNYNNTVIDISPVDYIMDMVPEPLAIINVLEIAEDEYNKLVDKLVDIQGDNNDTRREDHSTCRAHQEGVSERV